MFLCFIQVHDAESVCVRVCVCVFQSQQTLDISEKLSECLGRKSA